MRMHSSRRIPGGKTVITRLLDREEAMLMLHWLGELETHLLVMGFDMRDIGVVATDYGWGMHGMWSVEFACVEDAVLFKLMWT